jgi:hypothetical protein
MVDVVEVTSDGLQAICSIRTNHFDIVSLIIILTALVSDSPPIPRARKYDSLTAACRFAALGDHMSATVKVTQTDETPARLRAFTARSRDPAQSRRLLAIAMVLEGSSRLEAARQTGMDRQTLRDWA